MSAGKELITGVSDLLAMTPYSVLPAAGNKAEAQANEKG